MAFSATDSIFHNEGETTEGRAFPATWGRRTDISFPLLFLLRSLENRVVSLFERGNRSCVAVLPLSILSRFFSLPRCRYISLLRGFHRGLVSSFEPFPSPHLFSSAHLFLSPRSVRGWRMELGKGEEGERSRRTGLIFRPN